MAIYIPGTMAMVRYNAWGAELSSNYHQRSRVAGSRVIFGLLGTMLALPLIDNSSNAVIAHRDQHPGGGRTGLAQRN